MSDTEDILQRILSSTLPPIPEQEFHYGNCQVSWWEMDPGVVYVHAEGGTPDDRHFAKSFTRLQLEEHGYVHAQFDFDVPGDDFRKQADWNDLMAKAKRLIQSGQVQLLRNGYNYLVGHVIGDHGDYQTEISRDDPNSRSITGWQCTCMLPGGKVVMADGSVKRVEEVQTGDLVMTATGHAGIVGRTFVNDFDGVAVGMKIMGSTERVWLTDNHKLVTADVEVREAAQWTEYDESYLPVPVYEIQTEIDVARYVDGLVEHEGWLYRANKLYGSKRVQKAKRPTSPVDPRQKPIPARIELDHRFARLAGLFVAEGMVTPRGELRWAFGPDEMHLCREVTSILADYGLVDAQTAWKRHAYVVAVQSKPFAELFRALFGTGSRTKKLAPEIMCMPEESLAVFFDAWVEGDGHVNGPRTTLASASDDLAMQARLILARLRRESVIRKQASNASPLVPGGKDINTVTWRTAGNQVAVHASVSTRRLNRYFDESAEHVTQRMEPCEYKDYTGPVYNFEVLGEHSYVIAPGIASLNCPWDQYAWQRTRKWKKYEGRPCAHTLALYWKSLATPLDDRPPDAPGQPGAGKGKPQPAPAVPEHPGDPAIDPADPSKPVGDGAPVGPQKLPRSFGPDGEIQGDQQGLLPGDPRKLRRVFLDDGDQPTGTSPAAQPMDETHPEWAERAQSLWKGISEIRRQPRGPQPAGILPEMPAPAQELQPYQPGSTLPGQQAPPNAVSQPGARGGPTPQQPTQNPGTLSHVTADIQPSKIVRLKTDAFGIAEGPVQGQYGDGQYREVPQGSLGEVLDVDQTTGYITAIFPLDQSGNFEPYHVKILLEPNEVSETNVAPPGPFIRRKR